MDHIQKKEQNYAKWDKDIWLSVEKQLSLFQVKVTDCMLTLGDLNKKNENDFEVKPDEEVLGEQFYLELIRPECVKKGYLDKKIPTEDDLLDEDSEEESDEESQEEQKKENTIATKIQEQKGKKKGKKEGKNKKEENKMKVIKENFLKDIDMIFNTFTLDQKNVTFGFSQKKLEVKLITFFYIALYIRKNKAKKNIDESEIFELVNIMIKIVRIFDQYKAKSSTNENQMVEVSPTLILDMKLCIKGLKQYYHYTNKKIIINYPKLVYYTNYDQFFPTLDIKPYPSQIEFIQAVKKSLNAQKALDKPTLVFYKTMIGSGKTSASLALSQLIKDSKTADAKNSKYQLVYSCLIGSVRIQVGRYAYNKEQKFALGAMEKSIKDEHYYYPKVINSYKWKHEKNIDLIISDLDCTYEMLHHHHFTKEEKEIFQHEQKYRKQTVNVGKLDKENVMLFVDEPTAFCKDSNSPATRRLFEILANYPPKVIILASATMPDKSQLPNTIKLIERKNPGLQVFQIQSKEFQIGCQYCSFKGEVIFPHSNVKTKAELLHVISILEKNPFLLRLYTGPSLFFLLKKCEKYKFKGLPRVNDLPEVKQNDIIKATFRILRILKDQDDEVIEDICKLSGEEVNLQYKEEDKNSDSDDDFFEEEIKSEEEKEKADYVNFKAMLKRDAFKFLGGCMIATANPLEFAHKHFEKWVHKIKPIKRLIEKYERDVENIKKEMQLLEDDTEMREEKKIKEMSKLQFEKAPALDFPVKKKINTIDHYEKYCVDKEKMHRTMLIKPVPLESVGEQLLDETDDFILKLLFCGVAIYMERGLSSKYLDKVEELASQNYLAYIITDQSLCYGTNFPISNVILCDDLVVKLNMNEMFQLIGRAGRVGQSWTARAFLQEQGLKKLNDYIHSTEEKMSDEARIFQKIAQQHLNDPELALRTRISEIKYVNIEKPDDEIQVIIKKPKEEDYHIFRKVVVVPFYKGKVLASKQPYESFNSYVFPSSKIFYEDLPMIKNEEQEEIIDVAAYYASEPEFIKRTLNNTCFRILQNVLENKISRKGLINEFKPKKVYEEFFCQKTNTFVMMVKVEEEISHENYKFQDLKPNYLQNPGEQVMERLLNVINESKRLAPIIRKAPTSILANDVKFIKENHGNFMQLGKTKFYREIFTLNEKKAQEQYDNIVKNIEDKDSIECIKESIIALIFENHEDLNQILEKLFHIDVNIRPIWNNLLKKIE